MEVAALHHRALPVAAAAAAVAVYAAVVAVAVAVAAVAVAVAAVAAHDVPVRTWIPCETLSLGN